MHRFLGFKAESLLWSHSAPGGPGILQSWTRPGTTCSRHPVLVKKSRELEQHQDLPERYGYNWSKQWISSVRIAVANCRSSIPPQTKQYPLHITVYEWLRQLDLLFFFAVESLHRHWLIAPGDEKRLKKRSLGHKGPRCWWKTLKKRGISIGGTQWRTPILRWKILMRGRALWQSSEFAKWNRTPLQTIPLLKT